MAALKQDFQLTPEQIEKFRKDGYLVIEDFLSLEQVEAVKSEVRSIVDALNPETETVTVFTTKPDKVDHDGKYFLDSGDKIRYFFEKNAFNDKGELIVDKFQCLNKIGHALHFFAPACKKVSFSDKMKGLVRSLGYVKPSICQSMYIFKNPGIGGEVSTHQDATFLTTDPQTLIGVWFPLDDATLDNGCLKFIPGSHNQGIDNDRRMVRSQDRKPGEPFLTFTNQLRERDLAEFRAEPVKKGSLVLIDGQVVHRSELNTSDKPRHAYTFHIVDAATSAYCPDNWLQPTEQLPFPCIYDH